MDDFERPIYFVECVHHTTHKRGEHTEVEPQMSEAQDFAMSGRPCGSTATGGATVAESCTVCVIGAGPAGLATAKALADRHVDDVLVLEAASSVGGLWRPSEDGGHTWKCSPCHSSAGHHNAVGGSMRTNLSKHKCEFSDDPHNEAVPLFPSADHMLSYLCAYAEQNGIAARTRLHHKVTSVVPIAATESTADGEWWEVVAEVSGSERPITAVFRCRFVVVSTGVFTEPVMPSGLLSHPSQMASPLVRHSQGFDISCLQAFDKRPPRVLVVGNAYSGADLASAITSVAAKPVDVVCRRPRWYIPRWMNSSGVCVKAPSNEKTRTQFAADAVPWDLAVERRQSSHDRNGTYVANVPHSQLHRWCSACTKTQPNDMPVPIDVEVDSSLTVICDSFADDVQSGSIRVLRDLPPVDVLCREYDAVVCATGYVCRLPFLSSDLLQEVSFDAHDSFLPVVLYKSTLHPTRSNLFFVGIYRGPYMFALEVQARWVAALISGDVPRPSVEKINHGVEIEHQLRATRGATATDGGRPHGFPHRNVIEFADSLAEEYGAKPLVCEYPFLNECPVTASQYRFDNADCRQRVKLFKEGLDKMTIGT